jgi:mono/diheme cytochrome c family protein
MKKTSQPIHKVNLTKFLFAIVPLFLLSSTLYAQDPNAKWVAPPTADKKINPVAVNAQSIAAGKALFTKSCESCHGKKGKGDGPKSVDIDKKVGDYTTADFAKQSDGAIFWKITEGRKPMPSMKTELTDEQRWQLVIYVRELAKAAAKPK